MKKVYTLLTVTCLMFGYAHAQFEKGQKVIGSNIGLFTSKSEYPVATDYVTDNSSIGLNLSYGSFSKPNLLCGVQLSYGYSSFRYKFSENTVQSNYNNSIGLGVFAQRFISISQNLYFTLNTSAEGRYNFSNQNYSGNSAYTSAESNGYTITAGLAPGISYQLTPRFLFDAYLSNLVNVSYTHNRTNYTKPVTVEEVKGKSNSFSLTSSLSNTNLGNVGLGFRWLLKKK